MTGWTHRRRWYVYLAGTIWLIFIRRWLVEQSNDSCWVSWSMFLSHFQSVLGLPVVPDDPARNQMENSAGSCDWHSQCPCDGRCSLSVWHDLDIIGSSASHVNVSVGLCACVLQVAEDLCCEPAALALLWNVQSWFYLIWFQRFCFKPHTFAALAFPPPWKKCSEYEWCWAEAFEVAPATLIYCRL